MLGRPTYNTSFSRSSSTVPSTLRSGRAPLGNSPSSCTSTVTVLDRRGIDSDDVAGDDSVARVDRRNLADHNVLHLSFSNLQFGLQPAGFGNLGQNRSDRNALADLHRELLHNARDSRSDPQLFDLTFLQLVGRAKLRHSSFLCSDLRIRRLGGNIDRASFHFALSGAVIRVHFR